MDLGRFAVVVGVTGNEGFGVGFRMRGFVGLSIFVYHDLGLRLVWSRHALKPEP